jgi:hypothetical protein
VRSTDAIPLFDNPGHAQKRVPTQKSVFVGTPFLASVCYAKFDAFALTSRPDTGFTSPPTPLRSYGEGSRAVTPPHKANESDATRRSVRESMPLSVCGEGVGGEVWRIRQALSLRIWGGLRGILGFATAKPLLVPNGAEIELVMLWVNGEPNPIEEAA